MAVTAGVNTLKLSELGTAKSGVYLTLKDSNGYWSSLAKAEIPEGEVIAGITLDQTALVMEEGAETNLTAAILPEGAEAGKEITWTSDKPGVAAVTGNGKNRSDYSRRKVRGNSSDYRGLRGSERVL